MSLLWLEKWLSTPETDFRLDAQSFRAQVRAASAKSLCSSGAATRAKPASNLCLWSSVSATKYSSPASTFLVRPPALARETRVAGPARLEQQVQLREALQQEPGHCT